jgi:ATP-dependent RNA helicase DHX57
MLLAESLLVLGLLTPLGTSSAHLALRHAPIVAKQAAKASPSKPPSRRTPGKGANKLRSTQLLNVKALVCAACGVESSSETSFADHIYGAAHIKCAGYAGFAGLLPNAAGRVLALTDPQLLAEQKAYERGEPLPPAPVRLTDNTQVHPGELVCATCGTKCSSEKSFIDHLRGSTHRKVAGRRGYAGLVPNAMGLIPELTNAGLRAEAEAWEQGLPPPANAHGKTKAKTKPEVDAWEEDGEAVADAAGPARVAGPDVGYEGDPPEPGAWRPPLREVSLSADAERRASRGIDQLRERQHQRQGSDASTSGAEDAAEASSGDDESSSSASSPRRGRRAPQPMPTVPAAVEGGGPEAATRVSLPVHSYRDELLHALTAEVSIVEGETGSGKTTQVPQYLLEEAAASGTPVNIICTQPRRISAIGVSERVAAERGERVGEGAVGYAVRGESRQKPGSTALLFCTTGVLLRMLEEDPTLAGVTHVLVDEVHERSVDNDFLLLTLRMLLLARREAAAAVAGNADDAEGALLSSSAPPPLKLCLMSATLDGDVLSSYFHTAGFGVERVSFPGRLFPVTTLHLEDALELTGHVVDRYADWSVHSPAARKRREAAAALAASQPDAGGSEEDAPAGGRERSNRQGAERRDGFGGSDRDAWKGDTWEGWEGAVNSLDEAFDDELDYDAFDDNDGGAGLSLASRFPGRPASVYSALSDLDQEVLNPQLVAETVLWHLSGAHATSGLPGSDGAVLVFLPGVAEIDNVRRALLADPLVHSPSFSSSSLDDDGDDDGGGGGGGGGTGAGARAGSRAGAQAEWILPLHGSLPPDEQRKVFGRPPPGVTKVVLATNVAETSITIDDVTFVVDCGRAKLLSHDPTSRIASLDDVLISAAAAKQRRGRAGRVRPGLCVHLFPSDAPLAAYTEPEVRRVPLDQLLMRMKALKLPGKAAAIAAQLPEPPEPSVVLASISELETLGALDAADESLTPLGELLATLPIAPRLGKLIAYGSCFGAIDEALTIAAGLASRSPFLSPLEARQEADWSRTAFADGWQSDYLAIMHAYGDFDSLPAPERFAFARQRFLGIRTLQGVASLKRQLLEVLSSANLAPRGLRTWYVETLGRKHGDPTDGVALALELAAERSAAGRGEGGEGGLGGLPPAPDFLPEGPHRPSHLLLTGLLCAALYPQLAYVHAPTTKKGKPAHPSQVRLHMRDAAGLAEAPTDGVVHPASVNSDLGGADWHSPYVAYHDVCFTSKLYVRGSTPVPPLAPFIFCGQGLEVSECGAGDAWCILTLDGWLRIKVRAEVAPLLPVLRAEIGHQLEKMVERAANGGRRRRRRSPDGRGGEASPPARELAEEEDEAAILYALCDSIEALLEDAVVEPLKPRPKLQAPSGSGGSKKTRKRRAARKRKARVGMA